MGVPLSKVTELEVRYRIGQALELSPTITVGMLQAFLTSRIPHNVRDAILTVMEKEGKIKFETRVFRSIKGHSSTARVIVRIGLGKSK
jgi:hypothetical protein